jgi:hypothetical protein
MSIDSDVVMVPSVCRAEAGAFAGDEKMPEIGSMPYSSRTPLSSIVMPVLLR